MRKYLTYIAVVLFSLGLSAAAHAGCNRVRASGNFWFWIVPVDISRQVVQNWLPRDLVLEPTQSEKVPVVLWMGRQLNVKIRRLLHRPWNYNEFMIFVPNVTYRGQYYNHSPLLYLDHRLGILTGRAIGYPKQFANFNISPGYYAVTPPGRGTVITAQFFPEGDWQAPGRIQNFQTVSHFISNPIIQYGRRTQRLYYDWGVKSNLVKIIPAAVDIDFRKPLLPGFPVGRISIPSLAASENGAFKIKTQYWCLNR
jgi:hypothetical protein